MVHAVARPVTGDAGKLHGLRAITEHLAPGSWEHARQPDRKELAATTVLAVDLAEASVKVRTGPPVDEPEDVAAGGRWAGVLPRQEVWGLPVPCPLVETGVDVPAHITGRESGPRPAERPRS
ncbi:MAG: pyridoxamine 5'-phosphate oxidase family protein [Actinobacteria bacterium]|nr:pyridoxamine 5'-phosphate oxidase family protein [Actinomycetota bacterium]